MSNNNATLNAHPIQYTYQLGDPGPSWEVMKQEVPEYRRPESIQERFEGITSQLDAKEALVAEDHDVKLAMRSRSKRELVKLVFGLCGVVLACWYMGYVVYTFWH